MIKFVNNTDYAFGIQMVSLLNFGFSRLEY